MYRVLVVDDDEIERTGLSALDIFPIMNMQIIGSAWNGQQALELCAKEQPDIVISDIRMPVMDGLSFARVLKQMQPDTKIILISGFEDFAAAQQAIYIGADAYLVKPLNIDDLTNTLKQITSVMDGERAIAAENERLQARFVALLPVLQERILRDLLLGVCSMNDVQTRDEAQNLRLIEHTGKLALMIIQLDAFGKDVQLRQRQYMYTNELLVALSKPFTDAMPIAVYFDQYALIINLPNMMDDETAFEYLHSCASTIFNDVRSRTGCNISIAISDIGESMDQVNMLYTQALKALQMRSSNKTNHIYWYDMAQGTEAPLPQVGIAAEHIERCMLVNDPVSLGNHLSDFFIAIDKSGATIETAHALCFELLLRFMMLASGTGKDFLSIFENRETPYRAILEINNLADLKSFILCLLERAMTILYIKQSTQAQKSVERARSIIQEQYTQQISTETIAQELYIAPSHLRRIFKNITGQTIQECILATRMSRARELLFDPSIKVFEVAQAVGYDNHSYFCIVFKKYFGTAPGEYRHGFSDTTQD